MYMLISKLTHCQRNGLLTCSTQDSIPDTANIDGEIFQTEGYVPRPLRDIFFGIPYLEEVGGN